MCKICRNCGEYELRNLKRKPKYQRRKKRAATTRKVQKKQKTKLQARTAKKREKEKILKIHASTQSLPVPPKVLSPLCEKFRLPSRTKKDPIDHGEITPEMIHQALRELTQWSTHVELEKIFKYILTHYPVNRDKKRLKEELIQKLETALLAGMVCKGKHGRYRLQSSLEGLRQTPKAVLTLFWEIYCNTLDPIQVQPSRKVPTITYPSTDNDYDTDSDSPPDDITV